ncbi:hypothetical protein AVEN_245869-1 [Araneus ventricosus]|uniref:Uncharacterized protein n=1 Tax=Araneus ventricosus TaxID=182803 RepID=A0A4Y2TJ17_ARAVE|nr:hypothetical protein AVEN_245869-1 [Araneus ventricosus]
MRPVKIREGVREGYFALEEITTGGAGGRTVQEIGVLTNFAVCEPPWLTLPKWWDFRLKRYLDEIYIRSTLRKEGGPTGIPIPSQCYGNRNLPYQGRERENRGKNIPPPNNLHEVVLDTLICVCDSVYRKCQGGAERIVFTVPTFQKISPNIFYK